MKGAVNLASRFSTCGLTWEGYHYEIRPKRPPVETIGEGY